MSSGAGSGGFKQGQAVNILVIGTDKRTGKGNEGYGDSGQRRSRGHEHPAARLQGPYERDGAVASRAT